MADNILPFRVRTYLTDEQWNALGHLTSKTQLNQSFDIHHSKDGCDCFYDYEEDHEIPLKDGLRLLYEAMAYPLSHNGLDKEEAETIVGLFRKYEIGDEKTYEWLLKDEPEKDKGEER